MIYISDLWTTLDPIDDFYKCLDSSRSCNNTRDPEYVDMASTAHPERLNRDKPSGIVRVIALLSGDYFYAAIFSSRSGISRLNDIGRRDPGILSRREDPSKDNAVVLRLSCCAIGTQATNGKDNQGAITERCDVFVAFCLRIFLVIFLVIHTYVIEKPMIWYVILLTP